MAQFRTTADILDEILQKAGEPTNGNSPFETLALTYANKVHHSIIGGGSIFDLEVDEPWVWARSKHPITLELETAYTTGSISCTLGSLAITFSSAPTDSLEGWFIQATNKKTVYKITQHTAATTSAQLDSSFIDTSGSYLFRAFKLDYEIFPAYMYVDNYSDRIDFQETASATLSATLTHGAYSPSALIAHAATQIAAVGANTYSSAWDSVLKQFTITRTGTAAGTTFTLLGASGTNRRRSALPLVGYDRLDYTGNTTYTSSYTPNSISRLIEPFKIYQDSSEAPFIYSTDPVKMQEEYPISLVEETIPDRFVRLTEENDGTVWVRFNAYPKNKTKVTIDWIPTPSDLQDNIASFPRLPRSDVDTLIHGASAYLLFDKEDSKYESLFTLCKAGLEAMKKKNRALLFRTGKAYGQIIPRLDLRRRWRKIWSYYS